MFNDENNAELEFKKRKRYGYFVKENDQNKTVECTVETAFE